jgi:hypothetical protein
MRDGAVVPIGRGRIGLGMTIGMTIEIRVGVEEEMTITRGDELSSVLFRTPSLAIVKSVKSVTFYFWYSLLIFMILGTVCIPGL